MPSRFWRDAASLILLSSNSSSSAGRFKYEILTGIRSAKSSFMPKALVYPGGTFSKQADSNPHWMKTLAHFSSKDPSSVILDGVDRPMLISRAETFLPPDISFRLTAIRETFEETGVLLSQSTHSQALDMNTLSGWRDKVKESPELFIKMCNELEVAPDIWALHEWSAWLTPLGLHSKGARRFDTIFYMAFTDKDSHPNVAGDDSEIFKVKWMSPDSILLDLSKEEYYLGPPQVWETARLLNFETLPELRDFCVKRVCNGCISTVPVVARLPKHQGFFFFLPGDNYYPDEFNTEQPEEGFEVDHVDEEYKDVMRCTSNRNRIFIGSDQKSTVPFSSIKDPHGQVNPLEFVDLMQARRQKLTTEGAI